MITIDRITKEEFPKSLENLINVQIKGILSGPVLQTNANENPIIAKTTKILDAFKSYDSNMIATLVIPMNVIQVFFPKNSLLLSMLFIPKKGIMGISIEVQRIIYLGEPEFEERIPS